MRWIAAVLLCVLLAARAGVAQPQAVENPVLGQADALLRAGKAQEAWQLLSPLEPQYAGQQDFDYLLAVAALESGRPERATFILERVIAVNPGHVAARLEMARAYFALRDFERAEREFNFILNSDPPPGIRATVNSYLARMRGLSGVDAPGFSGYAEVALGRDTNVGAVTAEGSVFIPGLGIEFVPDPTFRRRADDFVSLGAGLEYTHHLSRNHTVIGGAEVRQRTHADVDIFDWRTADLLLGMTHRLDERDSVQYVLRHNEYELDHARYRELQSAAAQWSRSFGERARLALLGQGYRIRYLQQDVRASSSNLFVAGISAAYVVDEPTRTVATGGIFLGRDNAVAGRADGDRRLHGLNLGVQRLLFAGVDGYATFSLLNSDYEQTNTDFDVMRRDRQRDAAVGLSWRFADGWFLRPQVARTHNKSNLTLNEYRRTETSLTLRRVWE
jgi:outer membrane protein